MSDMSESCACNFDLAEHPVGEKEDAGQVYNNTPKLNDIRITSNYCRDTCYVMLFASEG